MSRPSDDELEAMAVRLEDGRVCSPAQNSCRNGYWMLEAAAMLRACKGRAVKPLPRGDGEGGWTLPMELLSDLEREVIADGWDGCTAEVTEIIALSVERRILAALEPAPDHSEWNAAIEAAARTLEERGSDGWAEKVMAEYAAVCAAEIRAITPPERPKP